MSRLVGLVTSVLSVGLLACGAPPARSVVLALPDTLAAPAAPEQQGARTGHLYRHLSALLPADGLLLTGLACEAFSLAPPARDPPYPVRVWDWRLQLAYGPWPGVRLELALPYRRWQGTAGAGFPSGRAGLGDVRAALQARLPLSGRHVAWSAWAGGTLPAGDRGAGLGEDGTSPQAGLSVALRLFSGGQLPEARLHLGAGRRWNHDQAGRETDLQSGRYAPWPYLYPAVVEGGSARDNDFLLVTAAVEMRKGITSLFVEYSEARLPWAPGIARREEQRFLTSGLHWGAEQGWGLSAAYDVCLSRDDLATSFVPDYPDLVYHVTISRAFGLGGRDRDGDGVPDRRDACPAEPEDRDGWRDEDGCPDPDNDGDGVPDAQDLCPNQPEDSDGWEDADGCPDEDNDRDGIADLRDACPDVPENFDGYQDGDGCPEELRDRDGDGVPDERDRCTDLPEDRDGFEDGDGCPDPDNDLDGIDDESDACPDAAEDYDGVEDDDGCPDAPASGGAGGAG